MPIKKTSQKIPGKILQILYNKNPRHISAEGQGQRFAIQEHSYSIFFPEIKPRQPRCGYLLELFGKGTNPPKSYALAGDTPVLSVSFLAILALLDHCDCDSPDPDRPQSPFSGKEGFGVQKFPFPLSLEKGVFGQKSPFFCKGTQRKWAFLDQKLPFPARVRAEGNVGFGTPKPSFPENGDSGPVWGQGNRNTVF